jgi:UDP-glucose 4-epimerase
MATSMKTVLVTGAAGFLGRHLAQHFASEGWRVIGVDRPAMQDGAAGDSGRYFSMLLPSPALHEVLRETEPDLCLHGAGLASVPASMEDPASDFHGNAVLTFELLEALRRHAPRCVFMLLSSAAVYGNPRRLPIEEKEPVAPLSPYGFHKRQAELLCEEFTTVFGLRTLAVRIFSAYGPGLRKQVVWDVCRRLLAGTELVLYGTGRESRDFIHAKDVARALALLAEKAPAAGEIYNVATARETTIAELVNLCAESLGVVASASFDGRERPGDPANWRANISKIAALGFAPAVPLRDGLRETCEWIRSVHP